MPNYSQSLSFRSNGAIRKVITLWRKIQPYPNPWPLHPNHKVYRNIKIEIRSPTLKDCVRQRSIRKMIPTQIFSIDTLNHTVSL